MDDLRRRLTDLDRIAVPDHWPEIERRAWSAARDLSAEPARTSTASATEVSSAGAARTRWIGPGRQPGRRSLVLTPIRVLAVAMVGTISVGLLAVSLSSRSSSPAGVAGAPGATATARAHAASPGPDGSRAPAAAGGRPIAWDTGCVQLTADWLRIHPGAAGDTPSQVFTTEGATVSLHSDPGSDTYRTLEATWSEGASEMRLNLYFEADEDSWWVRELRTYDGRPTPDWITYTGPLLETPVGQAYAGDVVLDSSLGNVPGRLEIRGLTLTVPDFGPSSGRALCLTTSSPPNALGEAVTEASPVPGRDRETKVSDPPLSRAVIRALDDVAADLLAGCYGREDGVARLSAALVEAGESGFFVRTDGPIGGPSEQMDEIMAHVDAGCVIYGGSGATADGARVFFIGGGTGAPTSTFIPLATD